MVKVSIIVPVYRVEKYLDRCVNSLMNQTLKDIEIILVDDGSPDNCPRLCDNWAKVDERIKVIHKSNGGLSSARNAGLKVANGKYVGFVDSDDDVEINMYEMMYNVAEQNYVDFVMCDYQRVTTDGNSYLKTLNIREGYYSKDDIIKNIYPSLIMSDSIEYGPLLSVWHCLYKLDFLKENNLLFDEDVKWSEDNIFSAIVGFCTKSFFYMKNKGLYHYYQNEGSITTSYRQGAWNVYKTMNNHLRDYFDRIKEYDFSNQLNYHLIYYACNCINMAALKHNFTDIKKEISMILSDKDLKSALKQVNLLNINRKLYLQLLLMKYQCGFLLTYIVKRRIS